MNKVAAIVVTYNRKDLLLENIKCLLNQKEIQPDIIVVDNCSNDGTYEVLEKYIKNQNVIYHNTGSNLGGAGGFQYGIRVAVKYGYKYLWIMDDDCMPKENALKELFDADKKLNGNYGFLSSKVLWKDGSICKINVQRHPLTRNITDFGKELIPATLASFVSLFLKSSVVEEVGLPIKEFFIWTDDWEYTRRISRKYPCFVAAKSIVIHKSAANIGADIAADTVERIERYHFLYRNDVYLYRREGILGFCYELVRLSSHVFRVLFKAKGHRLLRLKMIFAGTMEGLRFHPQIEYVK